MTGEAARPSGTVEDLIASLEAAGEGSRTLDLRLAYLLSARSPDEARPPAAAGTRLPAKWHALGDFPTIARIMLDEGFSWQSVCDVLDCEAPAYTGSLDAAIPGENIVFVIRSTKRARWGAIHRSADGSESFGWGATEPLARRTAALKAWTAAGVRADDRVAAPAAAQEIRAAPTAPPTVARQAEPRTGAMERIDDELSLEKSLQTGVAALEEGDWEILF